MAELVEELKDVRRLRLQPDDTLVIKSNRCLPAQMVSEIVAQMQDVFPDNKVIVLHPDLDLDVVAPEAEDSHD